LCLKKEQKSKIKKAKLLVWKDESDWKKASVKKDPRGKVTNMSDKARKETEKLSKNESLKEAHILSMHVEDRSRSKDGTRRSIPDGQEDNRIAQDVGQC